MTTPTAEQLIVIAGAVASGGLIWWSVGYSMGIKRAQASIDRVVKDMVSDNAGPIVLGKRMIDLLARHASSRGFVGSDAEITTSMNWDHAGRTYTFTLKEADQ